MPGLADEIEAALVKPGPKCTISILLAELDTEDRKALENYMKRWPKVQDSAVYKVLRNRQLSVTLDAIRRHRRQITNTDGDRCTCRV